MGFVMESPDLKPNYLYFEFSTLLSSAFPLTYRSLSVDRSSSNSGLVCQQLSHVCKSGHFSTTVLIAS
jgi:hypothetical protein